MNATAGASTAGIDFVNIGGNSTASITVVITPTNGLSAGNTSGGSWVSLTGRAEPGGAAVATVGTFGEQFLDSDE